jgi:hypothetical protein
MDADPRASVVGDLTMRGSIVASDLLSMGAAARDRLKRYANR